MKADWFGQKVSQGQMMCHVKHRGDDCVDRKVMEMQLPGKRKGEDQRGGIRMCRRRTCRRYKKEKMKCKLEAVATPDGKTR